MDNFNRAKIAISLIIKKIPVLYLEIIYKKMIEKSKDISFDGDINEAVEYLNELYNSDININLENINFDKLNINNEEIKKFNKYIKDNMNNICFKANVGSYMSNIEEHLSIKKNDLVLNKSNQRLLFLCCKDLNKTNQIRNSLFKYIKNTRIHTKLKKGDQLKISNYRFLFDHNNLFKIIDKILSIELLKKLEENNSMPDNNIVINNISRIFKKSIKENSYLITKSNENLILLDISKAYDNVEWNLIEFKLEKLLSKKVNKEFASNFTKKYLFLLKNRKVYFKENQLNIKKGVSTGLASSTIIFTLIFEEIFTEVNSILKTKDILIKNDFELKLFVDDICIKILSKNKTKPIINIIEKSLEYYGYKINKDKSKCSPNLNLDMENIKNGDCYLGLPFSNSPKNYMDIILKEFQNKHIDINYKDIFKILMFDGIKYQKEIKNKIFGFFNYKLYGIKKYNLNNSFDNFTNIIKKLYLCKN